MAHSPLEPHEAAKLEKQREDRRGNQPYAGELDDHELEHAHKENRPVDPKGDKALKSGAPK